MKSYFSEKKYEVNQKNLQLYLKLELKLKKYILYENSIYHNG